MNELLENLLMEEWQHQSLPRSKERYRYMAITLNTKPGQKLLELGGGAAPMLKPRCQGGEAVCVDVRACTDANGNQTVDFVADFEEPLPVASDEFDGVFCKYALEHIPYPKVPQFLAEVFRIIKPGGKAVFVVPNTAAQLEWLAQHPDGWDGKDYFTASSELLYGSQDYTENSHKNFFNPNILVQLFQAAGFPHVKVAPYNERSTDLVVEATKPAQAAVEYLEEAEHGLDIVDGQPAWTGKTKGGVAAVGACKAAVLTLDDCRQMQAKESSVSGANVLGSHAGPTLAGHPVVINPNLKSPLQGKDIVLAVPARAVYRTQVDASKDAIAAWLKEDTEPVVLYTPPEQLFDKVYFNGGQKVGGYAGSGYADFPVHWATFRHIMDRRPESVLEIGAARGYIIKRLADAGVRCCGLEVSKHCFLTRATDDLMPWDICKTPWPLPDNSFDLCFSIAVLEHIPEAVLPAVLGEMQRTCKRGLHGIDFGHKDDGFDRTHCTLKPREWWVELFVKYATHPDSCLLAQNREILDKEELESGGIPQQVLRGDGKVKLNIGSFTSMIHHGWHNIDQHDLNQFAQANGYLYRQHDVRGGLPYDTGTVDLLFLHHVLEHFSYRDGLALLRECRRVVKPDGAMRLVLPDAYLLAGHYVGSKGLLGKDLLNPKAYDEINDEAAAAPTAASKLWALLFSGHAAAYDMETLVHSLKESGWVAHPAHFRKTGAGVGKSGEQAWQILKETSEMGFGLSLFCDALPLLG